MNAPLFIISGPSGAGKTTLVTRLLSEMPHLHRIITYTTRKPRPGERDGVDYMFVSRDRFGEHEKNNEFIEVNHYASASYGTHIELLDRLARGQACVVIPDINGAHAIARTVPDAITIWLEAPCNVLYERLKNRGTEKEEKIHQRLAIALEEITRAHESQLYQHVIDTSDDDAYERLKEVIENSCHA